jgi:hypothetical protein
MDPEQQLRLFHTLTTAIPFSFDIKKKSGDGEIDDLVIYTTHVEGPGGDASWFATILRVVTDGGWKNWWSSQNAWYYTSQYNPAARMFATYAEGDITLVRAETEEAFNAYFQQTRSWMEERGYTTGGTPDSP